MSLPGFIPPELDDLDSSSPLFHNAMREAYDSLRTTEEALVYVVKLMAKRIEELEKVKA